MSTIDAIDHINDQIQKYRNEFDREVPDALQTLLDDLEYVLNGA